MFSSHVKLSWDERLGIRHSIILEAYIIHNHNMMRVSIHRALKLSFTFLLRDNHEDRGLLEVISQTNTSDFIK